MVISLFYPLVFGTIFKYFQLFSDYYPVGPALKSSSINETVILVAAGDMQANILPFFY
jgi:hypothetical protein